MTNVLFGKEYHAEYTSAVSTRVSNALLVGEVLGQVVIGWGAPFVRKVALLIMLAA